MNKEDNIIFGESIFHILYCEYNTIFNPEYFGIKPIWSDDTDFTYQCTFEMKEFQLYLKDLIVSSDRYYPIINEVKPEPFYSNSEKETVQYSNIMEPMKYSGAIVIGNQLIKNYGSNDKVPCYCYKYVKELFFQEGKLVTSIDHSKAMLRIRKNIDAGLRSLDKQRDVKCIQRYIKYSFAGDYNVTDNKVVKKLMKILHNNPYIEKAKKSRHR